MKKTGKALLLALCAVLLVAASVLGTLAYLTDTDKVVNTFTVGKVDIKLDEAKVDEYGKAIEDADRVNSNEYLLLPNHTYVKDPTVTVLADSEDCYVRVLVKVTNIDSLKNAIPKYDENKEEIEVNKKYYNGDLFLLQMLCNGWDSSMWEYVNYNNGVYEFWYSQKVTKSATDTVLDALFDSITVPSHVDNAGIVELAKVVIDVEAHAIQADGFDTAEQAWAQWPN